MQVSQKLNYCAHDVFISHGSPKVPCKTSWLLLRINMLQRDTVRDIVAKFMSTVERGKKNPKTTWNSFCLKILDGKPHFMEGQSPYKVTATLRTKITQPHMPLLLSSCYDTLMVVVSRPYEICCRREFSSVLRSLQCVHLSLQG